MFSPNWPGGVPEPCQSAIVAKMLAPIWISFPPPIAGGPHKAGPEEAACCESTSEFDSPDEDAQLLTTGGPLRSDGANVCGAVSVGIAPPAAEIGSSATSFSAMRAGSGPSSTLAAVPPLLTTTTFGVRPSPLATAIARSSPPDLTSRVSRY